MPNIEEAIEALLAYQQADMEGVIVLTSRQAIHEVADELQRLRKLVDHHAQGRAPTAEQYERLRRTLESRSVRLMGPRSPFWQCEYCQALAQTPIGFKHKPECLMADARPAERKNGDPCPSCNLPYTDGETCRATGGRGGCPMGGDF